MTYVWYEPYKAALLETDWTKMQERLHLAENALNGRQRDLSMDHEGTPEERQAIVAALSGLRVLCSDVAEWQKRQSPSGT